MINLKCAPKRQIDRADADGFKGIGKDIVATLTESLAPHHQPDPNKQADSDPAAGSNPVVVKCVFQKIRNSNQDRDDSNSVQPILSYLFFEISIFACGVHRPRPWKERPWCNRDWRRNDRGRRSLRKRFARRQRLLLELS